MPGDERAPELAPVADPALEPEEAEHLLESGVLEILGLMPRSSNATYLAKVHSAGDADREVLAIYKPRRGERPLWDFPEGTLAAREVASYRLARALGWPTVPPTVLRDGPEGSGAVQLFRVFDPAEHAFTLFADHVEEFRRIAAFDVVINNADRKGGHTLLGEDGRIFVIDHGVSFHTEPKLRTVIWEFEDEPLGETLRPELLRLRDDLATGPLRASLGALLAAPEVDAALSRTERLLEANVFPTADQTVGETDMPPYPWPAI